jgi:hypothetical protein
MRMTKEKVKPEIIARSNLYINILSEIIVSTRKIITLLVM